MNGFFHMVKRKNGKINIIFHLYEIARFDLDQ